MPDEANMEMMSARAAPAGAPLAARPAGWTPSRVLLAVGAAGPIFFLAEATPPGAEPTVSGLLHGLAFFCTFMPLPDAYALAALRLQEERGWRGHALYTAALPSVVFGLVVVYGVLGSDPGDPVYGVSGLIQRAFIAVAFGWITVTGWRLMRRRVATGRRSVNPVGKQR